MEDKQADFSGYATKANLECSDGRTIMPEAFAHMDGKKVPLVWQHGHNDVDNVLGHAILEARPDGVYAHAFFNDSAKAQTAKEAVKHGDVVSLSIYANRLVERSKQVFHGIIREVSLVLSGANPGALIDNVTIAHSDGSYEDVEGAAVIFTGEELLHDSTTPEEQGEEEVQSEESTEETSEDVEHADSADETVLDVYETLSDKQKVAVDFMLEKAIEAAKEDPSASVAQSDISEDDNTAEHSDNTDEGDLNDQEGNTDMKHSNVFEQTKDGEDTLKHGEAWLGHGDNLQKVMASAKQMNSFKEAVLAHAAEYGITDIDLLFPDAKAITQTPEFISRRMEWVATVLGGTKHSPFAKVKTLLADITADEARAKGYVKGNRKVEEVFGLLKRTTGPSTVYKKQKLDRDDIIDITDVDVVAWLKAEMRLMIEEELARAILVGDGRSNLDPDKIKDPAGATSGDGIRSILHDDDLYSVKANLAANVSPKDAIKGIIRARSKYRGSGQPTLFIDDAFLTDLMLVEDKFERPLYETVQALADRLRVKEIVPVEIFNEHPSLVAIMVSLQDYTVGANRGGELTSFEDFDIDFNQQKYLQETRVSGGLTKPFSAVVITRAEGTAAAPTAPSFDGTTNTITIPTVTGVSYFNAYTDAELTGDVVITSVTEVEARADDGYYIPANSTTSWTFTP